MYRNRPIVGKFAAVAAAAAILASSLSVSAFAAQPYATASLLAQTSAAAAILPTESSGILTVNYGAAASTGTVKVQSSLNLRAGAGTAYSVIGQLTNGMQVTILNNSNGWMQVKTSSGLTGYCSSSYITMNATVVATKTATVKVSSALNLRSGASTSSSVIGQLSNGQVVTVLSTSSGWSYVQTSSGQKGYCNSTYLLTNSTSSGTTTTAKTATVKVDDALNLRSGASTSSSVIGQLSNGQIVTVLSTSNGWSYVQTSSGQKGYCNSAYLLTNSTSSGTTTTTTTKTAIVKVSSALNLRSSASTSSSVIGQLSNGQIVTVLSTSNGWSYVQTSSGQKGYCSASYLVVTSSTQSASKLLAGLPAYKQSDSAWSGTTLGSSGKTIGTIGCTITSLAMSESYRTNSRVTPNDIARECSFTSGGGLYWPSNYYEMAGSNLTAVYQQLKAGKPVIVGGSSSTSSHWVIIKGYQNVPADTNGNPTSLAASMFLINDPGYNNSTLAEYFTQFPSGHVFRTY